MKQKKVMMRLMIHTSNVRVMELKIHQLKITLKPLGHIYVI